MTPLRADAQRNLERVLDAATEAFTASGPDASMDDIARLAGVGHATVFRRFPTKEALMLAVIGRRVEEIRAIAEEELASGDAAGAFERFVWRIGELHMGAPGLHDCVEHCGNKAGAAEIEPLAEKLVARAQRAGAIRRDLKPADVTRLVQAAMKSAPGKQWRRYVEVVLDGLSTRS